MLQSRYIRGMFSRMYEFCARPQRLLRGVASALIAVLLGTSVAVAKEEAVFIMYHRFDEGSYPTTNVTIEQFQAHIDLLSNGTYTVLPVPEILAAMRSGTSLPDRTVGITIDDAFLSVYATAWPMLRKAGLPFTVFIATQPVDNGINGYMSWDQVREMKSAGVTFGAHTASHLHMARADCEKNRKELERSRARYLAELGEMPTVFAYPYGEASQAARSLVVEQGFVAAFGQHSGVAYRAADPFYLPRFSFNEAFAELKHFRQRVNALALPAIEITPADPLIGTNPPAFGFTVKTPLDRLDRLACYHPQFDSVMVERLGAQRFEVRFPGPFKRGRSRLNCTVPGPDNRYHWFGWQFYVGGTR